MGGGLFAADAAGAKHCHRPVLGLSELLAHKGIPLTESGCVRVLGAFESAQLDFVIVPRINQQHVGIAD